MPTEQTPREFAEANGLYLFTEDDVAVNRSIAFKIETFEPTDSLKPTKPYKTRLKWSDGTGADQSKLLLTEPKTVIAEILQAKVEKAARVRRQSARRAAARARGGWTRFSPRRVQVK